MRLTGDVDERGVNFATFGGDEALDESGAAAAPHPGQADLHKLQVDAQRVFPARHRRRLLVDSTLGKYEDQRPQ